MAAVRVNDVSTPRALFRHGETLHAGALGDGASLRAYDNPRMPATAQTPREREKCVLPASPGELSIDVNDRKRAQKPTLALCYSLSSFLIRVELKGHIVANAINVPVP